MSNTISASGYLQGSETILLHAAEWHADGTGNSGWPGAGRCRGTTILLAKQPSY